MNLKEVRPIYIENSRLPVLLSKVAPINIWAISVGCWVWCKGVLTEETKRHEAIHFQQQLEMFFIGQWIFYILFWLIGLIRYKNGAIAYRESPFEREAYANEGDSEYLKYRHRYNWLRYIKDPE